MSLSINKFIRICRDPKNIKIRAECIEKMNVLLDPCLTLSNQELFKAMSNVLLKINTEFCEIDDVKVNSTIAKVVAASSKQGLECMIDNWNYVRYYFITFN